MTTTATDQLSPATSFMPASMWRGNGESAWEFITATRTWHRDSGTEEYTVSGSEPNLAFLVLSVARINEQFGKWATAAELAELTGWSRSKVNTALKRFRVWADAHHEGKGTLRYSKVGNTMKYYVHTDVRS